MAESVRDPREAGRDALIAWAVVAVLVTFLVRINVTLPAIGHLGSALVAVLFLYVPVFVAWRRTEDIYDYGFHTKPVKRGLVTAGVAIGVIFPIFALGYFAFYEIACHSDLLSHLVPHGMCSRYGGIAGLHAPALTQKLLEFCAVQLVVVALPEEAFFRGYLQTALDRAWGRQIEVLGAKVGPALLVSSAIFAVGHFATIPNPARFAVFVPSLLFGWLRARTGGVGAGIAFHAMCNLLSEGLARGSGLMPAGM